MIQIRNNLFETNSSSIHCIVYEPELDIPYEIHINDDRGALRAYYDSYGMDFLAWLHFIGVKTIYVGGKEITDFPTDFKTPRLFNAECECHNERISEEDMLKYDLFGTVMKEYNDHGSFNQSEYDAIKKYITTDTVWSEWFI